MHSCCHDAQANSSLLRAASAVMGMEHNHNSQPGQQLTLLARALKPPGPSEATGTDRTEAAPAAAASQRPRTLFIGLGGGTLPLALRHHFPGMDIDAIELDPVVVEAAQEAMAFPHDRH